MMQLEVIHNDDVTRECLIPHPEEEVLPGVLWGEISRPFTPAYWRYYCIATDAISKTKAYRLGDSLREELAACLLGGHGVTGEMGNAAYLHLKQLGLIHKYRVTEDELENSLRDVLNVKGRQIRYRFPRQKANYLSKALNFLDLNEIPNGTSAYIRNWLTQLPGIGMKTASWIVRNWLDADDVAILDIHIHRAGVLAGIFEPNDDVTKSYLAMESRLVQFATSIGIPLNILDNQIWNELRVTPLVVRNFLIDCGVTSSHKCGLPPEHRKQVSRNFELF